MRLPMTDDHADPEAVEHCAWNIRRWTTREISYLRGHSREGAAAIAAHLGRTVRAVRQQATRMRISLRRVGVRRGLLLGQPRGESWRRGPAALIRQAALAGELDLTLAEARVEGDLTDPLPVCPSCGVRPARHAKTGLCVVCQRRRLAEQYKEQAAEAQANREYQVAKQQAHRSRVCVVDGCDHVANGTGGMCWTHTRARRENSL